jgi:glutathione S-transferase
MSTKPKLGYWKIRGLAQPVRYLFHYAGQEFEDIKYEQGDAPDFSADAWRKDKFNLGLPFPNLPYLIDGDVKITQSNAILRYLGGKFDLLGESNKVRAESEMMLEYAMDFRNGLVRVIYNKEYEKLVDGYFKNVEATLKGFDQFLEGRTWFAGGKNPTICDFPMYELLDQHRLMRPDSLKEHKNLQAFLARFEQLPQIKAYQLSDQFMSRPVNNKNGGWR